jgi:hypothetical protein
VIIVFNLSALNHVINSCCNQLKELHSGLVPSGKQKSPNIPSKNGLSKYEKLTTILIPR